MNNDKDNLTKESNKKSGVSLEVIKQRIEESKFKNKDGSDEIVMNFFKRLDEKYKKK